MSSNLKTKPRTARVQVKYFHKGKKGNKSAAKMAELESGFTYADIADGGADTISIGLINADMRFFGSWFPKKKDKLKATIISENFIKNGKQSKMYCGKFCLDSLTMSGPELTCTIEGTSVPENGGFRANSKDVEHKSKTLYALAKEIAKRHHMKLVYSGPKQKIKKPKQNNSDCEFLNDLCTAYGFGFKIYAGKIVIYDKTKREAAKPSRTIKLQDIISWDYTSQICGTYDAAKIKFDNGTKKEKYKDKKTGKEKEHEVKDTPEITVGKGKRILKVNETAANRKEARIKAAAAVDRENEKAVTMHITVMGNTKLRAGKTIRIKNAKNIGGKYFIDRAEHRLDASEGYTTDLELHKVQKRLMASVRGKKKKK